MKDWLCGCDRHSLLSPSSLSEPLTLSLLLFLSPALPRVQDLHLGSFAVMVGGTPLGIGGT